mmetsp:Transcript_4283/g.10123  ORF Transcript_4283/g.10123 Transcript_4283/m.10123 type:complete len:422 (-) Transcript_4283:48-1313(-)
MAQFPKLQPAFSTPAGGLSGATAATGIDGGPEDFSAPPPMASLVRARSEGMPFALQWLAQGRQRLTDKLLERLLDDKMRTFPDAGHDSARESDWSSVLSDVGSLIRQTSAAKKAAREESKAKAAPSSETAAAAAAAAAGDAAGEAKEESPSDSWKCLICREDFSGKDTPANDRVCGRGTCTETFCRDCLESYFTVMAEDSKFMVLPVRCPASGCRARVPTEIWTQFVEDKYVSQYNDGARNILSLRCAACDGTRSLLVHPIEGEEERVRCMMNLVEAAGPEPERQLRRAWAAFREGRGAASQVLFALRTILGEELPELESVLRLIPDVERRCVLHLTALRENPKIRTPCCNSNFCWKCKVASHHEGQTCEEVQAQELQAAFHRCPSCGVPTQRTEGCNHMVCLCGADWHWPSDDEGTTDFE